MKARWKSLPGGLSVGWLFMGRVFPGSLTLNPVVHTSTLFILSSYASRGVHFAFEGSHATPDFTVCVLGFLPHGILSAHRLFASIQMVNNWWSSQHIPRNNYFILNDITQLQLEPVKLGILITWIQTSKGCSRLLQVHHHVSGLGNLKRKPLPLGVAPLLDSIQHIADVPARFQECPMNICTSNLHFSAFYLWGYWNNCWKFKIDPIKDWHVLCGNHGRSELWAIEGTSTFQLLSIWCLDDLQHAVIV